MRNGAYDPADLSTRLSRRQALRTLGLSGLGLALLSACAPQAAAPAPDSKPAAPAAPAAAPAGAPAKPAESQPAAAKPAGPAPKDGGTFRFNLWTEDPPTLDPYLNVSFRCQEFAAFFYSRLLMSKKGPGIPAQAYVMEGDLAESWKPSEDGKSWTFNLRPEAKWHNKPPLNGRPVTGADVAWSFERFMKVSPQKTAFDQVLEVSAPSERSVQFKLKDVYAPFEAAIGAPVFWILPKEIVEADGDVSKRVVGSGPFIFDNFQNGVGLTGKRNPAYHRKGEPHVDEIQSAIIPDVATRMAALRGKQLDLIELEEQDVDALRASNPDIQIIDWERLYIPFLFWKLDRPPFNDPRVRQAISMGIDREEFIKATWNGRGGYNNAIPWALSEWWLDPRSPEMGPGAKYFKYDPAEAKKLLSAAGFPEGMKADIITSPGYGQIHIQRFEMFLQQMKAIGIEAEVKIQEYSAYISTTFLGKFDGNNPIVFALETPFTEPHDFLFNMYHPKGTRNHAGVNDAKLTEMIEKQMRTLDKADRKKQIFEIQRYLGEQMYYPPFGVGYRSHAVQSNVRDFFPRSDYGLGAEVIPKVWIDR